MRIAVSEIAWRDDEEEAAARLLADLDVRGVELVPGRVAAGVAGGAASDDDARRRRATWADRGLEVVAMQALLFGRGDLQLFGDDAQRSELVAHLARVARIGGLLGASALVLGAPRNRQRGELSMERAMAMAVATLREAGRAAAGEGVVLCIEPNPPRYGCDFVNTSVEARELVRAVDEPGFGLHLDAAALAMVGEGASAIVDCAGLVRHFHASAPDLLPVVPSSEQPDHAGFARALRDIDYGGWVSIEMRAAEAPASSLPALEEAVRFVTASYGELA